MNQTYTSASRSVLHFSERVILLLIVFLSIGHSSNAQIDKKEQPNFVIIFADDLGYGDLGCYGASDIKTPRIDRMAEEGMIFTDFYGQTVCGPSRAALMTGCYPLRVATEKNRVDVHPYLHTNEITIAEILQGAGYATAAFGKWDLAGHTQAPDRYTQNLLPTSQGFDYFFGTSSSNDNRVHLLRNDTLIEMFADMSQLTRRYTDEAIQFVKDNKGSPFFIYLAHTMPHIRLEASKPFAGKSQRGIYGDIIEEMDWNVGRILDSLNDEGLDQSTYVIFTSDNGPWYLGRSRAHLERIIGPDAEEHGGLADPLRGAKTSTWEGGLRVPFLVRAPGRVPAGQVCREIASTMDMLPTLAHLAGSSSPSDRVIDGHNISDLFHGISRAATPTTAFFYYQRTQLQAVRSGKWKLHIPREADGKWGHYSKAEDDISIEILHLFNLIDDIGESTNIADEHPDIVAQLTRHIEWARKDIGDFDRIGENARFFDPEPKRPDINNGERF
ncbi:MAG TPA: N-acetylgalactosamine-6-sulfatase [Opitutae bacterium]|nr:N-acetylgalactosamine-6-sulfatase [Opitutaceae bacterium]HCR30061.1 N-acetylgalactosamine-6-sulfatase [Opitutae bacterium]